jgi:GDPmannose 4,6-dehydratase
MTKIALITGITGQDGSYLSELLLEKSYIVYGIVRRNSMLFTYDRIEHIRSKLNLHYGDLTDSGCIHGLLNKIIQTHSDLEVLEVYNLAAQSHVGISFENPEYTADVDALGALRLLEAMNAFPTNIKSRMRFYQASTSELFGAADRREMNEHTPFNPVSPYAAAKMMAHTLTKIYREGYGLFAAAGILFNHESPRRGANFVTQKIIHGIKDIVVGKSECIELGNINSVRDWGHAKDYVRAMWLILQQDKPEDYVIASGRHTSVRDFIVKAFAKAGYPISWEDTGLKEVGKDAAGVIRVRINEKYYRPCEVEFLLGDAGKARRELGWVPEYDLESLIDDMLSAEKN